MATSTIKLPSYSTMFEITQETFSFSSNTVAKNSYKSVSQTITNTGWYPVGIVGYEADGTYESYQHPYRYYLGNRANGSATLYAGLFNRNSSNAYAGVLYVYVLWQKVA